MVKLLEILRKANRITDEQYNEVIEEKKREHKKSYLDILYEKGIISKKEYLQALGNEFSIKYMEKLPQIKMADLKVPIGVLRQVNAVPVEVKYDKVVFAIADPRDWNAQAVIKRYYPDVEVQFVLAFKDDIEKAIKILENKERVRSLLNEVRRELQGAEVSAKKESAVMRFIQFIMTNAIDKNASDIHIEAGEKDAEIRYRIFGTLYQELDFDLEIFNAIDSGIKLISGLDVSEKRKPQDGAFSLEYKDSKTGKILKFDFRVSTLPTVWGESVVIRILDKRNIQKNLDNIGISERNLQILKKGLASPNGIFLVTGPTGSGKSTTLYASLREVTGPDVKVITVEDPVEYKVSGIQQVQVNDKIGMTFPAALKSILRQDPDVILIGEIRDKETLEIAIKAALTGHLVISTLHTNDAVSAVSRMIDMGVEPFFVASSLVGVEAQRLVKTVCEYCKAPYKPKEELLAPLRKMLPKNITFYKGTGCEKCNMTGYSGRTLISEVFLTDEKLETLIARNADKSELLQYLKLHGFKNMFMDGLHKAIHGITTLEEVYRVAKL